MAGAKRFRKKSRKKSQSKSPRKRALLDIYSPGDINKLKGIAEQALKFHWDYYCSLAYQRSKITDEIKRAFLKAAKENFEFPQWQRVLKYKYSLKPFSVAGSLSDPGGRFNIEDINSSQFSSFPAFYIAIDKITSLQELLCQRIETNKDEKALDFALADPESVTNCSLSGCLDSIIDLREPKRLQPFVNLIKNFVISDDLKRSAKDIGESVELIQTTLQLIDSVLLPNWRVLPMQFDVPSSSQIFGQLVADAGIEGILYPSKFTSKNCLVIFPQNFNGTDSFIEMDDESPPENKIRRLDEKVWKEFQSELQGL